MELLRSRVLLRPRDLDAALGFYEGQLGLHRAREFGTAPHRGVVLFLGGGGELELGETSPDDVPPPAPTGVRLWLQVPDLEATTAELTARGVTLTAPPERKPWGLIEAEVRDPDGLPVILVEIPAGHPLRTDTRPGSG